MCAFINLYTAIRYKSGSTLWNFYCVLQKHLFTVNLCKKEKDSNLLKIVEIFHREANHNNCSIPTEVL